MSRNIKGLILIFLLVMLTTGCIQSTSKDSKKIDTDVVKEDMGEFYSRFSADFLDERITVTDKEISNLDGEIVKYTDTDGNVRRYTVILYGEGGKRTMDYYFLKNYIYVSVLEEYYAYPVYLSYDKPSDIMYRTFQEMIIDKDAVYQLENGKFIKKDLEDVKLPYTSLEELDRVAEE